MTRHLILATLLVAGLALSCAADTDSSADAPSLADREGRSALVFGFNGEWLSSFDGRCSPGAGRSASAPACASA
jgi:hypothetical protein